jgi:hypothetical protein
MGSFDEHWAPLGNALECRAIHGCFSDVGSPSYSVAWAEWTPCPGYGTPFLGNCGE